MNKSAESLIAFGALNEPYDMLSPDAPIKLVFYQAQSRFEFDSVASFIDFVQGKIPGEASVRGAKTTPVQRNQASDAFWNEPYHKAFADVSKAEGLVFEALLMQATQHPHIAKWLIESGDQPLEYHTGQFGSDAPRFWGVDDTGQGRNALGQMLDQVRKGLQAEYEFNQAIQIRTQLSEALSHQLGFVVDSGTPSTYSQAQLDQLSSLNDGQYASLNTLEQQTQGIKVIEAPEGQPLQVGVTDPQPVFRGSQKRLPITLPKTCANRFNQATGGWDVHNVNDTNEIYFSVKSNPDSIVYQLAKGASEAQTQTHIEHMAQTLIDNAKAGHQIDIKGGSIQEQQRLLQALANAGVDFTIAGQAPNMSAFSVFAPMADPTSQTDQALGPSLSAPAIRSASMPADRAEPPAYDSQDLSPDDLPPAYDSLGAPPYDEAQNFGTSEPPAYDSLDLSQDDLPPDYDAPLPPQKKQEQARSAPSEPSEKSEADQDQDYTSGGIRPK